jgi:hypothetical protein
MPHRWPLIAFFLITAPAQAFALCTGIPVGAEEPAVKACESRTHYTFQIAGKEQRFDKRQYQNDLKTHVQSWLAQNDLNQDIAHTYVEIWLSVPELNPAATKMRAVFKGESQDLVFFLPIDPKEWDQEPFNVGITTEFPYPESFGNQAGELLIKKAAGSSTNGLVGYLQKFGISQVEPFASLWFSGSVGPLTEEETVRQIEFDQNSGSLVEQIQPNAIVEWMALRERVFAFFATKNEY